MSNAVIEKKPQQMNAEKTRENHDEAAASEHLVSEKWELLLPLAPLASILLVLLHALHII